MNPGEIRVERGEEGGWLRSEVEVGRGGESCGKGGVFSRCGVGNQEPQEQESMHPPIHQRVRPRGTKKKEREVGDQGWR
jgi:hypothetical protein